MKVMQQYVLYRFNDRERKAIVIGIGLLIFLLGYFLIYQPIQHAIVRTSTLLEEKKQTLVWMRQAAPRFNANKIRPKINPSQLLANISQSLKRTEFSKFSYQLQQTHDNNIELSFNQVPFNLFLNWLHKEQISQQFHIERLQAEQTEQSGMVKLTLILTME